MENYFIRKFRNLALEELHSGQYKGVNYVVADGESGWVIHAGNETNVVELEEGLSIIGENDVDDPRDERVAMARSVAVPNPRPGVKRRQHRISACSSASIRAGSAR